MLVFLIFFDINFPSCKNVCFVWIKYTIFENFRVDVNFLSFYEDVSPANSALPLVILSIPIHYERLPPYLGR